MLAWCQWWLHPIVACVVVCVARSTNVSSTFQPCACNELATNRSPLFSRLNKKIRHWGWSPLGVFSQPSQPPQPRIPGPINHGIHEPLDPCHAQEFKPCHYRCEREWEFAAGPRTMTSPCHRTDTGKDLPHLVCQLTPLGSMYFGLVLWGVGQRVSGELAAIGALLRRACDAGEESCVGAIDR
jgi:hypothetical protein